MNDVIQLKWQYKGCMSLPYEYSDEELNEVIEQLGSSKYLTLPDEHSKGKYGSLHVWRTKLLLEEANTVNLNNYIEQSWTFINRELVDESHKYLPPGTHDLIYIEFLKNNRMDINPRQYLTTGQGEHLKEVNSIQAKYGIHNMLDIEDYVECAVSPDGEFFSIIKKSQDFEANTYNYELILYKLNVHNNVIVPVWSARYKEPHTMRFSPDSKYLAFITISNEGYWDEIVSIGTHNILEKILLSGLHNANNLCWEGNSLGLFFICDDSDQPDEYSSLHYQSLADRMPWWRKQKVIGHITFDNTHNTRGVLQRITPKMYDVNNLHIAKERNELIYIEEQRGNLSEPYLYITILNLNSYEKKVIKIPHAFITSMQISPCNNYIAYIGSRIENDTENFIKLKDYFNEKEKNFKGYGINIYDTKAYLLDIENEAIKKIGNYECVQASIPIGTSRINQEIYWSDNDHVNYIGTLKSQSCIVSANIKDGHLDKVFPIGKGVSKNHCFINEGTCLFFYSYDGKPFVPALLNTKFQLTTLTEEFENKLDVAFNWDTYEYLNISDIQIPEGWIYIPEKKKNLKKTPLVVYLYGGASPLTTGFDDLHQCLLTHGIAVLVLNPSGCAGYGSQVANLHVNDWGKKTVQEISHTIQRVIESYPIIDETSIGIYGGSYGGFLSNLLIAQTDIFKAACTIGGISNITSYWGSSYFGYLYGLSALSNSYPWSNKDIFVDQSPIYLSEQINTPLLLLHGEKDVNVPLTESEQMFTSLKIQNKEASFVVFQGEPHSIKSKPSAHYYQKAYIISWFEKYLKNDSTLWDKFIDDGIEQVY